MISKFLGVVNLNKLILKLAHFMCNWRIVLPVPWLALTKYYIVTVETGLNSNICYNPSTWSTVTLH